MPQLGIENSLASAPWKSCQAMSWMLRSRFSEHGPTAVERSSLNPPIARRRFAGSGTVTNTQCRLRSEVVSSLNRAPSSASRSRGPKFVDQFVVSGCNVAWCRFIWHQRALRPWLMFTSFSVRSGSCRVASVRHRKCLLVASGMPCTTSESFSREFLGSTCWHF